MAIVDGNSKPPGKVQFIPTASSADKLGALERSLSARLEELRETESRISRKMEHLTRTELSLQSLLEALRQQISGALPVIDQLRDVKAAAEAQIDSAIETARAKLARESNTVVAQHSPGAPSNIQQNIETQIQRIDEHLKTLDRAANTVTAMMNERMRAAVEQAKMELAETIGPLRDSVQEQSRIERENLQELSARLAAELAQTRPIPANSPFLESPASDFNEVRDSDAQAEMWEQARNVAEAMRQKLSEQIADFETQVQLRVEPIIVRIDQAKLAGEMQLRTAVDGAERCLRDRVEELSTIADTLVEGFEHRLVQRIQNMRPRAIDAMNSLEEAARKRIAALLEQGDELVREREGELAVRVREMRPRVMGELEALEHDLSAQLAQIEREAESMMDWLEKRLVQRVDESVARSRQTLGQELSAHRATDPVPAHLSQGRVEVELHVDAIRRRGASVIDNTADDAVRMTA
jgi:hypothetical protein